MFMKEKKFPNSGHGEQYMKMYPTAQEVRQILEKFATGEYDVLFGRFVNDLDWTIMGDCPLSKHYSTKSEFLSGAFARLRAVMKEPLQLTIKTTTGGGESPWVSIENHTSGVCLNGLEFEHDYVWFLRFNEEGMIVQGRAYLDTTLLTKAIVQNEKQEG